MGTEPKENSDLIKGEWWLPDHEEGRIRGTLTIDPGSEIVLDLIGSFAERENVHDVIFGRSTNGKLYTLEGSAHNSSIMGMPGFEAQAYDVLRVYKGTHTRAPHELEVRRLHRQYTHLVQWLKPEGLDVSGLMEDNIEARYVPPDPQTIRIDENLSLIVRIDNTPYADERPVRFAIEPQPVVEFQHNPALRLREAEAIATGFWWFLSFATGKQVQPKYAAVTAEDPSDSEEIQRIKVMRTRPQVDEPDRPLFPTEVRFSYEEVEDRFGELLRAWYDLYDDARPAIELLITDHYGNLYSPQRFLVLIQALETYHRRRSDNVGEPPEEFEARKERIMGALEERDKNFVSHLFIRNEPTLLERLDDIWTQNQAALDPHYEDPQGIRRKVKDTRNYYTHYGEDSRGKAATGEELGI